MQSALNHILFRFKNGRNLLVIMTAHMTESSHCGQLFRLVGHITILIQHCRAHTFTSVNFQMYSPYVITKSSLKFNIPNVNFFSSLQY